MHQDKRLSIGLELVWWLVTLIVLVAVLLPIWNKFPNYPFWAINIVFVVAFITFSRYIFLLKHTFFSDRFWFKIVFLFLCLPMGFYLIDFVNHFQTYMDENSLQPLMDGLSYDERENLTSYIRNELLFFGSGSVIACGIFMFRLVYSIWRRRNRGLD